MTQSSSNLLPGLISSMPPDVVAILTRPLDPAKGEIKQDVHRQGDRFQPKYPPSQVVIRRLNEAFGYNWSDTVQSITLTPDWNEVIVLVRVTARVMPQFNGSVAQVPIEITHDGIGRALTKRDPQGGLCDYGNDVKAAHTDGLRKAATKFGFSLELYDKDESAFQGMTQVPAPPVDASTQLAPDFQVQQVVGIFEHELKAPRANWLAALQIPSPDKVTVLVAEQIMSRRHPVVYHFAVQAGLVPQAQQQQYQQQSQQPPQQPQQYPGQQYGGGLHATNA